MKRPIKQPILAPDGTSIFLYAQSDKMGGFDKTIPDERSFDRPILIASYQSIHMNQQEGHP